MSKIMDPNSADKLAEILRTTLYLVEQRHDLDQGAQSVSQLKESMRRRIAELEQNREPTDKKNVDAANDISWTETLRRKIRR